VTVRVQQMGDEALLLDVDPDDAVAPAALATAISAVAHPAVAEVVPAAVTVLVRTTPGADLVAVAAAVTDCARHASGKDAPDTGDEVVVPVVYDGADLAEVAGLTGLTQREIVAAHTGQVWTVAFCGFAPGFGYLRGEDDRLHVPRRSSPRTRVSAGAVALADEFTGIYPTPSPGGWQLIGRTDLRVWDLDRRPPALLRPGVRVRFVATGEGTAPGGG
jgi:KipI family sensor histidine kinase inhibitor